VPFNFTVIKRNPVVRREIDIKKRFYVLLSARF